MQYKKELKRIEGDENTLDEKYKRTLQTKEAYERCAKDFEKETWRNKKPPKSNWYPETTDRHVYGEKK